VKDRTGAKCNVGYDLGIGPHLLRTTKEWMIIGCFACNACTDEEERRECDGDVDTAGGGSNKGQRGIKIYNVDH